MIDKIPLAIARRVNGLGFASRKFSAGLRNACDFTASHGLWAYVDISGRSGVDEWSPLAVRMIEKVSPDENQANMLAPDPQKGWFASALNRTGPYKRIKFRGAAVLRLDDENNAEVRAALAGIDKDFSQWISR